MIVNYEDINNNCGISTLIGLDIITQYDLNITTINDKPTISEKTINILPEAKSISSMVGRVFKIK